MLRLLPVVALVACATVSSVQAQVPGRVAASEQARTGLFRHASVQQAWNAARVSRRPMLLYVTSDHCFYCKKMLKETYAHPQIAAGVAGYAEPVEFNASQSPELAAKLGVRAYPTTLVISPDNKLLAKIEGFVEPPKFAERMWPVLEQAELERQESLQRVGTTRPAATLRQPQQVSLRDDAGRQAGDGVVVVQD